MVRTKYFTPNEIALHNTADDLWVTLFGKVLDLTPLCKGRKDDALLFGLLAFGGKDISHFFDETTKEVKLHVDPNTHRIDSFLPYRRFVDAPFQEESEKIFNTKRTKDEDRAELISRKVQDQTTASNICCRCRKKIPVKSVVHQLKPELSSVSPCVSEQRIPWWKDDKYVIGLLSKKTRLVRILNTMIKRDVMLEVCSEETLYDILQRYLPFNRHAIGYTWKFLGSYLDMQETLDMNGIPDRKEELERLNLNEEDFVPALYLYFNDDLTEL